MPSGQLNWTLRCIANLSSSFLPAMVPLLIMFTPLKCPSHLLFSKFYHVHEFFRIKISPFTFSLCGSSYLFAWRISYILFFSFYAFLYLFRTYTSSRSSESRSVVSDSLRSHGLYSPWNFLGQNTGVGKWERGTWPQCLRFI